MGNKSKTNYRLNWGKSQAQVEQCCDTCEEPTHRLIRDTKTKKWECKKCAQRLPLEQPRMFGKMRTMSHKQYEKQNDFIHKTKF